MTGNPIQKPLQLLPPVLQELRLVAALRPSPVSEHAHCRAKSAVDMPHLNLFLRNGRNDDAGEGFFQSLMQPIEMFETSLHERVCGLYEQS